MLLACADLTLLQRGRKPAHPLHSAKFAKIVYSRLCGRLREVAHATRMRVIATCDHELCLTISHVRSGCSIDESFVKAASVVMPFRDNFVASAVHEIAGIPA